MPQGPKHLRERFMTSDDDGIAKCRELLTKAGCIITDGLILFPNMLQEKSPEAFDALLYLVLEWDYAQEVIPQTHPGWEDFFVACREQGVGQDITTMSPDDWMPWWQMFLAGWDANIHII